MPSPEHKQPLVEFVRTEIDEFHSGNISRISTNAELQARFGYLRTSSFYPILRRVGLLEERRKIKKQGGQKEPIIPSQESAWMIGILAGGGNNNLRSGAMVLSDKDKSLLQAVKSTGERLFEIRGNIRTLRTKEDGTVYNCVHFHNYAISRQLGDLRRDRWPQTIIDKHPWILGNDSYIANFLQGIFDVRGLIAPQLGIIITTSYPAVANFLSELLTRLGIENPLPAYTAKDKQKLKGIGIWRKTDMKLFADQIHSRKPEKEAKLEIFRQRESARSVNPPIVVRRSPANKAYLLIDEYKKAREISLKIRGSLPTILDIAQLRHQGVVHYTAHTLANHFGDGSFIRARQRLEDILSNQEGEHTEAPLPKMRVYARHPRGSNTEIYNPGERLIEEYSRAREICLRDKNRLPQICDIAELRDQGIVDYTAHTLAIYFGDRSFVSARENLERIIAQRE